MKALSELATTFGYSATSHRKVRNTVHLEAVSEVTRRPKPPSVDSRFRENDEMLCRITHQFILSESDIVITVLA